MTTETTAHANSIAKTFRGHWPWAWILISSGNNTQKGSGRDSPFLNAFLDTEDGMNGFL